MTRNPPRRLARGCLAVFLIVPGVMDATAQTSPPTAAQPRRAFVAIYDRGPRWLQGKGPFEQAGIQEHISHHEALAERLIGAAPFVMDPDDAAVGLVVFEAQNREAAQAWLAADPAVVNGVMKATLREWRVRRVRAFP
jgi:uncharacterized protein YciI